jgi:hypothetical protein
MNFVKNPLLLIFIGLILFDILCVKTDDGSGNEDEGNYEEEEIDINEKPLIITKESFIKVINQPESGTFVMFHAPWWYKF